MAYGPRLEKDGPAGLGRWGEEPGGFKALRVVPLELGMVSPAWNELEVAGDGAGIAADALSTCGPSVGGLVDSKPDIDDEKTTG